MGSMDGESKLVHDVKISSVVPARAPTGDDDVHQLTPMDLVMKLHYIKGLYFFNSDAARGLDILYLKKYLFDLLEIYRPASGRVRRSEDGRPFIKCNDGGVRIVEANCNKTVDEWLALAAAKKDHFAINDQLVPFHVLGPDLGFSPLLFIQFTFFRCGGCSIGLSWAHILGDSFSLSKFINIWGQIMEGHVPTLVHHHPLNYLPNTSNGQFPHSVSKIPISIKSVEPVGDYWLASTNDCKMKTHSFHVTHRKLDQILSLSSDLNQAGKQPHYFQLIAAIVWKSLAKTKGDSNPRVVTICSKDSTKRGNEKLIKNGQLIGSVEADFEVGEADVLELVKLISEGEVKERNAIEEFVIAEGENSDFIVYGANLTFVNLEDEDIYGFQLKGKRPVFASYTVSGVGEEGLVVVLPASEGDRVGRTITVTMPENKMADLKIELAKEWGIY